MATIASGSSTSITLASGDYLEGTGAGLASIGVGGKLGIQPLRNGAAWQIGPFQGVQSIYISASSLITYTAKEVIQQPVSAADRLSQSEITALQSMAEGAGIVGPYADLTALQTAKPAASNIGVTAYVGASAPYTLYRSDGSVWAAGSGGVATNLTLTRDGATATVASDTGTDAAIPAATTSLAGVMTGADKTKLDSIATGATVAPVTSVAGRTGAVTLAKADVGLSNVDNTDDSAKPVSTAQQTALDLKAPIASPTFTGTVSGVTKAHVGLGNVDNTSDANKPVSTATQTALNAKQATLVSATNIKTVNGLTLLGAGDLAVGGAGFPVLSATVRYVSTTGDDGTATAGNISLPYATVRAAVDAAAEGDVVALFPGEHVGTAPLVLKKNVTLCALINGAFTKISFDGTFQFQLPAGTGPADHGGQIQPALGISGVDACFIKGLTLFLEFNTATNALAAVTGVNTAAGTAITGTGASYCDMRFTDCDLVGRSDVHISIDAKQRTYFNGCRLSSGYDFMHLLGPANLSHVSCDDCTMLYRPFRQTTPTLIGSRPDTILRVRQGSVTLSDCELFVYNDGASDWSTLADTFSAGMVVDNFAGAKIIINGGLRRTVLAPFTQFIFGFASNAAVGTQTLGSVVVNGRVDNLLDYNTLDSEHKSPVRVVPTGAMTAKTAVFAAAAASTTRANTFRCTAAAAAQTFSLFTLPPGVAVKSAWINVSTLFSGGAGVATTIEIGTAAVPDKYLAATNVRASTGLTQSAALNFIEAVGDVFDGAGTLLVATLRNTGANVSTLTAGEVVVCVELAAAPN